MPLLPELYASSIGEATAVNFAATACVHKEPSAPESSVDPMYSNRLDSLCDLGGTVDRESRSVPLLLVFACLLPLSMPAMATTSARQNPPSSNGSASLLANSPQSWIPDVAANEIRAIQHPGSFLRYRVRTVDAKGDHTRDVIESKDGSVARLLYKSGKPITQQEDQSEHDRLNEMIATPSEFTRHIRNDATGKKLAIDLIRLMPEAMLYTYTPGQPQLATTRGVPQIVIDYAPNPKWSPPNTTAEALTGLRGTMWIDPGTRQLIRMEGTIFQGVNFGWGMLAHIYPGGKLSLDQVNVGEDRWIFSHFAEQVRVRALLLKNVTINTTIDASGFHPLARALTYQEAIHLLLESPVPAD